MEILQVCNKAPYPPKDGGCIAMNNITEGLISAGHQVKVLAFNTHKHSTTMFPEEYKRKTKIETFFIDTRIKAFDAFMHLLKNKSYNISRFYSKNFEKKLMQVLEKSNFDIIHLESIFLAPYLNVIKKHSTAKIILRAHNVEYEIWEKLANQCKQPLKKIYLNILAKQLKRYELNALNNFDGIACITQNDLEHFEKMGIRTSMRLIPFGIQAEKYEHDVLAEKNSFFHLGSMDWAPNVEGVLWFLKNVWSAFIKKHPEAKLYLAGRGMPKEIFTYANENVFVKGEISNAVEYMQRYETMIVPLFSGSGMRVKLIEGLAMGKNVISTSLGMQGISGEHGKHFWIADTAIDFIDMMSRSIEDEGLTKRTGAAGKSLINRNYDNHKICENLVVFYQEILNR